MPITHIQGNLITSDCNVIAHGCNCFCVMGGGIAAAIVAEYPGVYELDSRTVRGDAVKLGTYGLYKHTDDQGLWVRSVFNLYTQYRYGAGQDVHLDYGALRWALEAMKGALDNFDPRQQCKVGFPRIGCGLAGGDWNRVEEILEYVFWDRNIYVYTL